MNRFKEALLQGAQNALQDYGVLPGKKEPSLLRKAVPYAAAAAAAGAGFKYLRTPTLSNNPAMRKIQQQAVSKGFHRVVDVSRVPTSVGASIKDRLIQKMQPQVDAKGQLNLLNKAKLWLQEGSEAIPIATHNQKTYIPGHEGIKNIEGVVARRNVDAFGSGVAPRSLIHGGIDAEGSLATQKALSHLAESGKGVEADFLRKHAPEAFPETISDLSQTTKGLKHTTSKQRLIAIKELQKRMLDLHKGDPQFLLKPTQGLKSGGKFPRGSSNWEQQLGKYETHMADPVNRKALGAIDPTDLMELTEHLNKHDIYEGHTLHDFLKNPKNTIAQKEIMNPLGEYRVHTTAGNAPASLVMPRQGGAGNLAKLQTRLGDVKKEDIEKFTNSTLAKFPEKYRSGHYGMDTLAHRNPDGSVGFKILELNPSEMARHTGNDYNPGGTSGMLYSDVVPGSGLAHYRAMTGRHAMPVAIAGGLGAAGATGIASHLIAHRNDDEQER